MTALEVSFEQFGNAGLRPFASKGGTVAAAVSGGSDSLALLAWAHKHAHSRGLRLLVLTVDHGLRPGSKTDAEWVAEFAESLGHRARILKWTEPVEQQDAARNARHKMLAAAAKAGGAEALLLGHTFDDVVETCLLRRRRNRQTTRLAGPAFCSPSPVWPAGRGLTLCRPLLWQRRAHLREELQRIGLVWQEDPSNQSPKYERNRIRRFLTEHPKTLQGLIGTVGERLLERHAFDGMVAQALREAVSFDADGLIRADLTGDSSDAELAGFGLLARIANGSDRTPRAQALANAIKQMPSKGDRTTVAGAWVQRARGGFLIGRDPGADVQKTAVDLWDGRFEATQGDCLPEAPHVLVRNTMPQSQAWREIMSERFALEVELMSKAAHLQLDVETLKMPISLEQVPLRAHPPRSEAPV